MRIVDTLIVFRILKLLTTPWEKQAAFKFGFIDKEGKRIKTKPREDNPNLFVQNDPFTAEEKASMTLLHRLVFNLKRLINKVPFGKTAFASYAVALALLKEEAKIDANQMEELCEKFYHYLKDNDLMQPEQISECMEMSQLSVGKNYRLRRSVEQGDEYFQAKSSLELVAEHSKIFGIPLYVGFIDDKRILVTSDDVY